MTVLSQDTNICSILSETLRAVLPGFMVNFPFDSTNLESSVHTVVVVHRCTHMHIGSVVLEKNFVVFFCYFSW